jgi:hypothetical protein
MQQSYPSAVLPSRRYHHDPPSGVEQQDCGQRGRADGGRPPTSLDTVERDAAANGGRDDAAVPAPPGQSTQHHGSNHLTEGDQSSGTVAGAHPSTLSRPSRRPRCGAMVRLYGSSAAGHTHVMIAETES